MSSMLILICLIHILLQGQCSFSMPPAFFVICLLSLFISLRNSSLCAVAMHIVLQEMAHRDNTFLLYKDRASDLHS